MMLSLDGVFSRISAEDLEGAGELAAPTTGVIGLASALDTVAAAPSGSIPVGAEVISAEDPEGEVELAAPTTGAIGLVSELDTVAAPSGSLPAGAEAFSASGALAMAGVVRAATALVCIPAVSFSLSASAGIGKAVFFVSGLEILEVGLSVLSDKED